MAGRVVPLAVPAAHPAAAAMSLLDGPLALLCAPLGPLLRPLLGAQGVVPVLGPVRRPLPHNGLDARVRLLHLCPQLVAAGVVVEAAMYKVDSAT